MSYRAKPGDCILSIAAEHGLTPDAVWKDAAQKDLSDERQDESVLKPGDPVVVRPRVEKTAELVLDKTHRFRRLGVPARVRFRLEDEEGAPRAALRFTLDVDGVVTEGNASSEGIVEATIWPQARSAVLRVGVRPAGIPKDETHAERADTYLLRLGYLDPVTTPSGARWRLIQTGYLVEETQWDPDYDAGKAMRAAIRLLQEEHKLPITGKMDPSTEAALLDEHGC